MVAIGQAEVVARTGATWRWHRAGVIAITEAWPLQDDVTALEEMVWTHNSKRDTGGDCYFVRDAGQIGSHAGFVVIFEDGTVEELTYYNNGDFDSSDLTARYGEPVSVEPNGPNVKATLGRLNAERRVEYLGVRALLVFAIGGYLTLTYISIRRRVTVRRTKRDEHLTA